jgi:hypothetical protein
MISILVPELSSTSPPGQTLRDCGARSTIPVQVHTEPDTVTELWYSSVSPARYSSISSLRFFSASQKTFHECFGALQTIFKGETW